MPDSELIKMFKLKYYYNIINNHDIFIQYNKNNDENYDTIDQYQKKILKTINIFFYKIYIEETSSKNLLYDITLPFILEDLSKYVYIACPYYNNNKVLNLGLCLPIALYDKTNNFFMWKEDQIRLKMIYHEIGKNIKILKYNQISNIDESSVINLILLYRIMWYIMGIKHSFSNSSKIMKSNSLITFNITKKNTSYILFCLIDLGFEQNNKLIDSNLSFFKEFINKKNKI